MFSIIIIVPHEEYFPEMKQRDFLTFLNVNGIPYYVCETLQSKCKSACSFVEISSQCMHTMMYALEMFNRFVYH